MTQYARYFYFSLIQARVIAEEGTLIKRMHPYDVIVDRLVRHSLDYCLMHGSQSVVDCAIPGLVILDSI